MAQAVLCDWSQGDPGRYVASALITGVPVLPAYAADKAPAPAAVELSPEEKAKASQKKSPEVARGETGSTSSVAGMLLAPAEDSGALRRLGGAANSHLVEHLTFSPLTPLQQREEDLILHASSGFAGTDMGSFTAPCLAAAVAILAVASLTAPAAAFSLAPSALPLRDCARKMKEDLQKQLAEADK
ncbi:hypothetical protein T484DRAFT_1763616, partial [Baffinella frigidus]